VISVARLSVADGIGSHTRQLIAYLEIFLRRSQKGREKKDSSRALSHFRRISSGVLLPQSLRG
jgi:hypothetical protein